MHSASIQNIVGKLQDRIPKRTRAQNPAAVVVADLPIKSAQGSFEPRICERAIEDCLTLGIEDDPSRDLPDVGIEFGFRAPLDMAFEKPDDPKTRRQQRRRNGYGTDEKEAEFEGSGIHGFIDSMM
jgi:hypothetical protein